MIRSGRYNARKLTRARILLKSDQGSNGPAWTDQRISQALDVGVATIERLRKRFFEEGLEASLNRRPEANPRLYRKLDGHQEARWDQIEVLRLILDNLNIHNPAAFYEVFDPAKARRLLNRLEFHYTPKHASWLNIAEIELSVLSTQCFN